MHTRWVSYSALFLFVTPEVLAVPAETQLLLYGSLMVIVSIFMPGGIAGGIAYFMQAYSTAVDKAINGQGSPIFEWLGSEIQKLESID